MPRRSKLMILGTLALVGCAHTEKQPEAAAPSEPAPPQNPQLVAKVANPGEEADELEAALRNAKVLFDFDSTRINPEGLATLDRLARVLRKHHGVIQIEGNCDERGTEEYNLALGQKRAAVARQYLINLGVDPRQLATVSYGALRPANPAHSEEAWSQNRRDELRSSR